jgi:hypothetical protein
VTITSASGTLTSVEDRARHAVDEVVAAVGGEVEVAVWAGVGRRRGSS